MLAKVPNRETQTVVNALIKQARKLPNELYQSLTWDRAKSSPTIVASLWKPTSPSTSAIHKALGSAAQTKTPTGFCANTSHEEPTWRRTPKPNSTGSRVASTSGQEKRWTSKRQLSDLTNVLHRPVEAAL